MSSTYKKGGHEQHNHRKNPLGRILGKKKDETTFDIDNPHPNQIKEETTQKINIIEVNQIIFKKKKLLDKGLIKFKITLFN